MQSTATANTHPAGVTKPSSGAAPWFTSANLRLAFARVKDNHGCAGSDGMSLAAFEAALDRHLDELFAAVANESYWPWPLRRVLIEKHPGSTESRRLAVPAVRDRVLQTCAAFELERRLEPEFEDSSFAYRRGRGVRMAVERVHALQQQGYEWLVDADIDGFFDSLPRDVVLGRLRPLIPDERLIRLVAQWLQTPIWDGSQYTRPTQGLPQGLVVSPLLANLCLDHLDEAVAAGGWKMVRYADDFVILAKSRKQAESSLALVKTELAALRLRLNAAKTRILRRSDGMRFLGVIFLNDLLMQPWRRRKQLKVIESAPGIPGGIVPEEERKRLRAFQAF